MWLVNEQFTVQYAEEVYAITPHNDKKGISILCPTRKTFSRGDTLNLGTLTIDLKAEFDEVISLEVTHFQGSRRSGPNFELFPDGKPHGNGNISQNDSGYAVSSGRLKAIVSSDEHTFNIKFHAGDNSKPLTSLLNRSVGLAYSPALSTPKLVEDLSAHKHYIFTQTEICVGETIHGLGERFGAWNRVGQHLEVWNEDGGTSSEQAYKNISFWLSSKGYGVFIDTPDRIDLEIGSERCSRVQTTVEGQRLKWYVHFLVTADNLIHIQGISFMVHRRKKFLRDIQFSPGKQIAYRPGHMAFGSALHSQHLMMRKQSDFFWKKC